MIESKSEIEVISRWQQTIQNAILDGGKTVAIRGSGSKPALHAQNALHACNNSSTSVADNDNRVSDLPADQSVIDSSALSGIIDYHPNEFTVTAYAGTPLAQLEQTLSQHQQYLPFDPPRISGDDAHKATIGGAVAAGINGPGRWRYGGIRDFVLETRFIDGAGQIRTGGRRVVKNAAGFDIPKLMVGSCGRLGALIDVTLKVLPKPEDFLTIHVFSENLEAAAATVSNVAMSPWELDAIEIQKDSSILIRLSGNPAVITEHGTRLQNSIHDSCSGFLLGAEQDQVWKEHDSWLWDDSEEFLVRVPLNLRTMLDIDEVIDEMEIQRRYGCAGNIAWLKWLPNKENPGARLKKVAKLLSSNGLTGMIVRSPDSCPATSVLIGANPGQLFYQRLKNSFDPQRIFGEFYDS